MKVFEISEEEAQTIGNIVLEIPTKFGNPIINILNSLQEIVEEIPEEKK